MRYKLLGWTGLRVAEVCLGTMTFGEESGVGVGKEEGKRVFERYAEAGGNFIDTANNYNRGTSERMLSDFLGADRERYVLATKFSMYGGAHDPNQAGNQRKNMVQSLEQSLQRLKTDYVDLYWIHAYDFLTPPEEMMRALDDLVRAGKILYAGISNAPAWVIARSNTMAQLRGWTPFAAMQMEYSLLERSLERELLPMGQAMDIAITAWSPLASGLLSGKYNNPKPDDVRRLDHSVMKTADEASLRVAGAVGDIASRLGITTAQLGLAWVKQMGVIPIVGARTLAQLEENLGCLDITLDDATMAELDQIAPIQLGFPHDFLALERIQRAVYGGYAGRIDAQRRGGAPKLASETK